MNKRILIIFSVICLIILSAVVASAASEESLFFDAGKTLRDYYDSILSLANTDDTANLAAIYQDKKISWAVVEQNRSARMLYAEEGAQPLTDREVVDSIVEGMIMVEEAQRLGIAATQAEIDSMVEGTKLNYEIPEVKELLDDYCAGAGITIEEYYDLVKEYAPAIISKQKLRNELGRQYCQDNGLEYTNINPPAEMIDYVEEYIRQLFEANQDKIVYYFDADA